MFQLYMLACNMLMTHNLYLYLCFVAAHDCVPRFTQASACVYCTLQLGLFLIQTCVYVASMHVSPC